MKNIFINFLKSVGLVAIKTLENQEKRFEELNSEYSKLAISFEAKVAEVQNLQEDIKRNAERIEKREKHLADAVARYDILERTKLDMKKNKKGNSKDDASVSKLKNWSLRVKQAFGNKCDICEATKNLTAHHLWDKSTHPTLMYQDENGVCLCMKCHNGFHATFTSMTHCTPKMYQKYKTKTQSDAVFLASIKKKES